MYRIKKAEERPNGELTVPVFMDLIKEEMRVLKSLSETIHEGPESTDTNRFEFLRKRVVMVTDECQGFLDQIADHLGLKDS